MWGYYIPTINFLWDSTSDDDDDAWKVIHPGIVQHMYTLHKNRFIENVSVKDISVLTESYELSKEI